MEKKLRSQNRVKKINKKKITQLFIYGDNTMTFNQITPAMPTRKKQHINNIVKIIYLQSLLFLFI